MNLQKMFARFFSLRKELRALIALYWIYSFILSFTAVLTQVFLYSRFESLPVNIVATMLFFTGSMFGFCIVGYLASRLRLDIRHGYAASFVLLACSFILLICTYTPLVAYIAMTVSGIANGFFYLALHTFELHETKNQDRDRYATFLSVGDSVNSVIGPAAATALVYISGVVLHWGTFTLIFIAAPFFYALGFLFLNVFSEYRPAPITFEDITYFFRSDRNRALQLNTSGEAFGDVVQAVVLPAAFLLILGNALNVGTYTTVLGIGSLLSLWVVARYRKIENRLSILAYTTVIIVFGFLWLGYVLSFSALVIYGIIACTAEPLMSVSNRAITFRSMEANNLPASDFYPSMVIRDFSLWMWRMVIGGIFLMLVSMPLFTHVGLSLGLYLSALGCIITYIGARTIVTW